MADQTPDLANAGEREDRLTRCARCGTRSRDTAAVSLTGTLAFTIGIAFWLIYGPAF